MSDENNEQMPAPDTDGSILAYKAFDADLSCRGAATASGDSGAATATGHYGRVRGAEGCALFLVYRDFSTDKILHAWAGIAGQDGIEPMAWYRLGEDGKPVKIED